MSRARPGSKNNPSFDELIRDRIGTLASQYAQFALPVSDDDLQRKKNKTATDWVRIVPQRGTFLYLNGIQQDIPRSNKDIEQYIEHLFTGTDKRLVEYIKVEANQHGFLYPSLTLLSVYISELKKCHINCPQRYSHFIQNQDGSISFMEMYAIDSFRNPTGDDVVIKSTEEGRPLAWVMTLSTIRLTGLFNKKVQHEFESENIILLDKRAKELFDPKKDKLIDRTEIPTADVNAELDTRLNSLLPTMPSMKQRILRGVVAGIAVTLTIAAAVLFAVGTGGLGVVAAAATAAIGVVAAKIGFAAAIGVATAVAATATVAAGAMLGALGGAIVGLFTRKKTVSQQDLPYLRDVPPPAPSSTAVINNQLAPTTEHVSSHGERIVSQTEPTVPVDHASKQPSTVGVSPEEPGDTNKPKI